MKGYYKAIPFSSLALEAASMSMKNRVLICIGILLIDLGVFFLPLTAFFLIYIVLANPPWFREFLQQVNQTDPNK
jgi:hypothetical protein